MKITCVYHFPFPILEALVYELRKVHEVDYITTNDLITKSFENPEIIILLVSYTVQKDNPLYLKKLWKLKKKHKVIFYNDIELNMKDVYNKHILKNDIYKLYDEIWSYDESHKPLIEKLVKFQYVPYGYSKYYESYDVIPVKEYKYDFLFFGRTSKYGNYRKKQIQILKDSGLKIKVLTDVYHNELIQEIMNAKIVLNIKSGENIIDLDFPRYSLLVGLNKFFITDTYNDKSGVEDVLKSMFVFAKDRNDMITLANEYLSKPDEELLKLVDFSKYKEMYSGFADNLI